MLLVVVGKVQGLVLQLAVGSNYLAKESAVSQLTHFYIFIIFS